MSLRSTMDVHPRLPSDIFESIVDTLGKRRCIDCMNSETIDRDRTRSLQALSQTCNTMVPLCRKHLFRTLCIGDKSKSDRYHKLVSNSPDIISYVRDLELRTSIPIKAHDYQIFELLKDRSPAIRSIELWSSHTWDSFPQSIQALLEHLVELPTVTSLVLYQLDEIPISFLSVCRNVPRIALYDVTITPPDAFQSVIPRAILRPSYLSVTKRSYTSIAALIQGRHSHNHPMIIDFSGLQNLDFSVDLAEQMLVVSDIIQRTEKLQSLNIMVHGPAGWKGLGLGFRKSQARWSLKRVVFDVFVFGNHYDPLCGLPHELNIIAGENSIEKLELGITVNLGTLWRTETDDWAAVDTILTAAGSFPMLKAVFIEVSWTLYTGQSDSESKRFGEDQFPRLMESKSVEFSITINREYV